MLRFAHEFNGNWNEYSQKPAMFIQKWRQFTRIIREYTNMTAMMWAPNVAVGYVPSEAKPGRGAWNNVHIDGRYPFGEPSQFSARAGTADFRALDTNNDGRLDQMDDPYSPYWPGEEYVDWVAASIYCESLFLSSI
jgi:hypothetical protein